MSTSFKNWQGQLMGTIHNSPGGIKTVVTKLSAPNPKTCTVYFHHPHFETVGTKAGRNARMMTVAAHPPDVYQWLSGYSHVTVPQTLIYTIHDQTPALKEVLEFIVYAELKENVLSEPAVVKRNKNNVQMSSTFPSTGSWAHTGQPRRTTVWKIEPWYFVDFTAPDGKIKRTSVSIETADLMLKMLDPTAFHELDHEKLFEHLMKIKIETLAGLWFLKPEYFQVLQVFAPDRWDQLYNRAKKGIIK